MIQANEYRLGNWVTHNGNIIQIEGVDKNGLLILIPYEGGGEHFHYLEGAEPIPLTPEVLEACGCELSSDQQHWFIGHHGFCLEFDGQDWCLKMDCTEPYVTCYVRYLHQFQNMYLVIAGKELTYSPIKKEK